MPSAAGRPAPRGWKPSKAVCLVWHLGKASEVQPAALKPLHKRGEGGADPSPTHPPRPPPGATSRRCQLFHTWGKPAGNTSKCCQPGPSPPGTGPKEEGLRERNSPICTLSQNGYGVAPASTFKFLVAWCMSVGKGRQKPYMLCTCGAKRCHTHKGRSAHNFLVVHCSKKDSAWRRRFSKHENLTYQALAEGPSENQKHVQV